MTKAKEIHDLMKLPDHIIIKSQQVEIGKLNSYTQELEEKLNELKNKTDRFSIDLEIHRLTGLNKKYKSIMKSLENKIKKLKEDNFTLKQK